MDNPFAALEAGAERYIEVLRADQKEEDDKAYEYLVECLKFLELPTPDTSIHATKVGTRMVLISGFLFHQLLDVKIPFTFDRESGAYPRLNFEMGWYDPEARYYRSVSRSVNWAVSGPQDRGQAQKLVKRLMDDIRSDVAHSEAWKSQDLKVTAVVTAVVEEIVERLSRAYGLDIED